jgi:ADP-ribose pyrophosphatase
VSNRERYFELVHRHPELFVNPPSASITIELEPEKMDQIEQAMAQRLTEQGLPGEWASIGVAFEDQYGLLLRDAVYFGDGTSGTYIRFVSEENTPGVIILPIYLGHVILINHFRHATRTWHLELPRGFGRPGLTSEENARRELHEEIGANASRLLSLGRAHTDTGMSTECNEFFFAQIDSYGEVDAFEGIDQIQPVAPPEFERLIRENVISDGYTIIAYARAKLYGLL